MRVAISNIAWDVCEDKAVASLLNRYNVDAIDIAPGKYFPEPERAKETEIASVKSWWVSKGVEITGMQALLFGTSGLNLFAESYIQKRMLNHLDAVCRIASVLGATRLVFGSPKNRDRSGVAEDDKVEAIAISFFRRLGDIASSYGVLVCLEPNPSCYGANFMTNSRETVKIVEEVDHPSIRMQLDTGAITINGEDIALILKKSGHLIGHIHASEPDLVPLNEGITNHGRIAAALSQTLPHQLVSIEMLATKDEPHIDAIEHALQIAIRCYRNDQTERAKG